MSSKATLRHIIYDVLRILKQEYDNAEITPESVAYWVINYANKFKRSYVKGVKSGAFLTRFHVTATVDDTTGRNYFALPATIYDYDDDKGIDYITYRPEVDLDIPVLGSVTFTRTTPQKARRLYFREDEKPSPSNPYWYREGDNIIILGCENINLLELETGVYVAFDPVDSSLDIDDEFDFPVDLIPDLTKSVLALGLFVRKTPEDFEISLKDNRIEFANIKDLES